MESLSSGAEIATVKRSPSGKSLGERGRRADIIIVPLARVYFAFQEAPSQRSRLRDSSGALRRSPTQVEFRGARSWYENARVGPATRSRSVLDSANAQVPTCTCLPRSRPDLKTREGRKPNVLLKRHCCEFQRLNKVPGDEGRPAVPGGPGPPETGECQAPRESSHQPLSRMRGRGPKFRVPPPTQRAHRILTGSKLPSDDDRAQDSPVRPAGVEQRSDG
jgi:hypothetical protein